MNIFTKKTDKKLLKYIVIYISEKYSKIIIAPMYENKDGIKYGQDICFVYNDNIENHQFGNEIINALNLYSYRDRNLVNLKKTDWPAFKYSELKTIKVFEENYKRIEIFGVNNANKILQIECAIKNTELNISSYISFYAKKDELGNRVREVYNISLKC